MIISLQFDQNVLKSLQNMVRRNRSFEASYPEFDATVSFEKLDANIIAPCFVYEVKESELKEKLRKKIEDRRHDK